MLRYKHVCTWMYIKDLFEVVILEFKASLQKKNSLECLSNSSDLTIDQIMATQEKAGWRNR